MKKIFFLVFIVVLLLSCKNDNKVVTVERAFYCWQDRYLESEIIKHLKDVQISKLYVKLFEVDYTEALGNYPFSKNKPSTYSFSDLDSIQIVPVIFIKNEIFKFNDEKSLDKLADNIVFLIEKYSYDIDYYNNKEKIFNYDEIQIDCDWTKSTKDKYFYLLTKIKQLSNKKMSCTLRLYAYKYPDIMGIPPVDKASLMCYNLMKPLSEKNKNSILDISEFKKYLNKKRSYPIHLDIALPSFFWTQLYQNNQFVSLIDFCPKDVISFAKQVKPFWYVVEKDTNINYDFYLKTGDQLKCEDVSAETINQAIDLIKKYVSLDKNTTISFFDLDKNTFNQYTDEEFSHFYSRFIK